MMQRVSPVNAFIQGREARQQYEANQMRNALAQMELQSAPQEMESRNRLADLQAQQITSNMDRQKATEAHSRLQQALSAPNAKAYVMQYEPNLAARLKQDRGIDLNTLDDQSAHQLLSDLARSMAGAAGIAPAAPIQSQEIGGMSVITQGGEFKTANKLPAPYQISQQPGPNGSTILSDGESFKVVEPDSPKQRDQWVTLSPDEMKAQGFSTGSVVQRNANSGEYRVVNRPDSGNRDFTRADKLRDEYNKASEEFIKIGDAYTRVREASKDPSAAGDLSLIFAYMKILDPNSVVREQEFANAQNAAGVPDRVRAAWNKALNGQRLSGPQRQDFINQAYKLYKGQKNRHETTVKRRYKDMAQRWDVNPDDVVGGFDSAYDEPTTAPEVTATGPNGQKLALRNGKWVPL